ncbi:MAG: preprotein translocase subunit SecA [Pirellulaceae bacterium]
MGTQQIDRAIPRGLAGYARAVTGGVVGWNLARWASLLPKIDGYEPELQALNNRDLRKRSLSLQYRAKSGEPLVRIMPEAYALVREAGRRALNMRHYPVQMIGGIALFHGAVAEMQTGEGKTLTATLPLYLRSLEGKGAHLATVNDYLAARDADWMRPLYDLLGVSVGIIQSEHDRPTRLKAYECDITYGTAKEFGFDFLRDRLLLRATRDERKDYLSEAIGQRGAESERPVSRGAHFALVDEADSILIDDARTPLIIGTLGDKSPEQLVAQFRWSAAAVEHFQEDEHYDYDHEKKTVELNAAGRKLVRTLPKHELLSGIGLVAMYESVERAIKVSRDFILDRQYVVRDDEIVIVDESTGRIAEGRKWREGIHQAIEAKENVTVTMPTGQAARITVQDLFLRYKYLAGMTGTATTSAREIHKTYRTRVVPVPTNRPPKRVRLDDRVFVDAEAKWAAIVADVREQHASGRPVLVGTRSIDRSERLSELLLQAGIDHQVLNAHKVEEEAEIVARAGEKGKVTVATNMAGRGTDIKLGSGVHELGGIYVICTELHDSARIDRQLIGRCGRQGDPGTFRQYLAMDDDILLGGFGPEKSKRLKKTAQPGRNDRRLSNLFRKAQQKVEKLHRRQRMILLYHEKQRKKLQMEMGQDPYLDTPD